MARALPNSGSRRSDARSPACSRCSEGLLEEEEEVEEEEEKDPPPLSTSRSKASQSDPNSPAASSRFVGARQPDRTCRSRAAAAASAPWQQQLLLLVLSFSSTRPPLASSAARTALERRKATAGKRCLWFAPETAASAEQATAWASRGAETVRTRRQLGRRFF